MALHTLLPILILGIPLIGFIVIGICGKIAKGWAKYLGTVTVGISLVLSIVLFILVAQHGHSFDPVTFEWLRSGKYVLEFGFHIDSLSVIMLIVVSLVSFLVHLFSIDYMKGDPGIARYYAELQLFTVAMLGVVTASNLLQMFAFWELVGLCSYLLIGFWFAERSVYQAAKKAFFVTKVGDVFLFIGIMAIFANTGTLNFGQMAPILGGLEGYMSTLVIIVPLCIFAGAMGKSAQFPIHVWLPNAMEGPTPVSALIHAATMVAAGIYLVARTMPIFMLDATGTALTIVMIVGAVTAFMGATIATVQAEIKKVLAFSTISQLGYMVMGLGAVYIGHHEFALIGFVAALFHLMTHAFFKGLLFLGSGSVIHATHTKNMHEMGGLIKKMPVTGWTFVIGSLALAGFPLFAGFWSKDAILGAVFHSAHHHQAAWIALILALIGAFLTPYYMTRCVWLTFFGKPRKENHAHEGSWRSKVPLYVLGTLAALVGFIGVPFWGLSSNWFQKFLGQAYGSHEMGHHILEHYETWAIMNKPLLFGSIGLVFAGILVGLLVYVWKPQLKVKLIRALKPLYIFFKHAWFMDEIWTFIAVKPFLWFAGFCSKFDAVIIDGMVNGAAWLTMQFAKLVYWFDSHVVDGMVNGVGWLGVKLSKIAKWFDENIVDGFVNGSAWIFGFAGKKTRKVQTGYLPNYAAVMFGSLVVILLVFAIILAIN